MTTINDVLDRAAAVRRDALDREIKAAWLMNLDGQLTEQVLARHRAAPGEGIHVPPRSWPEDADLPLAAQPPYDRLYDLYLFAMLDMVNRESANYNNSVTAYEAALDAWKKHYHRTHMPLGPGERQGGEGA